MDLISIIIPTYNRFNFLLRALESVKNQTYKNIEIIIINDKSDDENYYSYDFKPARIIHLEKNTKEMFGKPSAGYVRSIGMQNATGQYLAFLDDDDYWMPEKLEKQNMIMNEENVDFCYCAKYIIVLGKNRKRYSLVKPRSRNLHKSIMQDNFIGTTSSILVKKSVLDNIGGFDPNLTALQDYDLYIRIISKGFKVKGIDEPLLNYQVVDEKRSIACSYNDFRKASEYLFNKYRDDQYLHLLKKAIRRITIIRVVKSRRFMLELIRFYLKGFKLTSF